MLKNAAFVLASALGLALLPSVAHADITPPTVTSIKASNLLITSAGCRDVPVTLTLANLDPAVAEWAFAGEVEIWSGGAQVGSEFVPVDEDNDRLVKTELYWCPPDGFGSFRIGPTYLAYAGAVSGTEDIVEGDINSNKSSVFTIRMGTRLDRVIATKAGNVRTISARMRYFKAAGRPAAWAAAPTGTKVHVQRRVPGKTWNYLKTVSVGKAGVLTTKVTASQSYEYRYVFNGGTTLGGTGSPAVKR